MEKIKLDQLSNKQGESKIVDYAEQIRDIVQQLQEGKDIKICRCSYYPLRTLVTMAVRGEIGEKYRLIKN